MLNVRMLNSLTLRLLAARSNALARSFTSSKDKGSDSDSDRDVNAKKKQKGDPVKEETAADRLNKLLASMQTDDKLLTKDLNMARPGGNKKHSKKETEAKNVLEAVKNVANLLGDDPKQTESELLSKLLNHKTDSTEDTLQADKVNPNDLSLSELIVGMKIDRRQPATEQSRGDYVRKALSSRPRQRTGQAEANRDRRQYQRQPERNTGSVDLFGSKPLDVFKEPNKLRDLPDMLQTWEQLYQHELKLAVTHPPANYFQKMALWTEQGKLWKFPIDNEQGLDEDHATDFSEHVFLEQHLEPWCPTKGPVRDFMELVCIGLSKNPYISAKDKKDHILWYRDYFEQKKDILKATIAEQKSTPKDTETISAN